MNPQSTDKVIADTNALIPRVIYRGSINVTVNTSTSGAVLYYGTNSVTINSILASQNPNIEAWFVDNSKWVRLNDSVRYSTTTTDQLKNCTYWYIDSNSGKLRINFYRFSRTNNETFTIYYAVYSDNATEEVVL